MTTLTLDEALEGLRNPLALREREGDAQACAFVVRALRQHGAANAVVACWGCDAVGEFAFNHTANRDRLGEAGVCEAVVEALRQQHGAADAEVARWGCLAVGRLAFNHTANKNRLGEAGAAHVRQILIDAGRTVSWTWLGEAEERPERPVQGGADAEVQALREENERLRQEVERARQREARQSPQQQRSPPSSVPEQARSPGTGLELLLSAMERDGDDMLL